MTTRPFGILLLVVAACDRPSAESTANDARSAQARNEFNRLKSEMERRSVELAAMRRRLDAELERSDSEPVYVGWDRRWVGIGCALDSHGRHVPLPGDR